MFLSVHITAVLFPFHHYAVYRSIWYSLSICVSDGLLLLFLTHYMESGGETVDLLRIKKRILGKKHQLIYLWVYSNTFNSSLSWYMRWPGPPWGLKHIMKRSYYWNISLSVIKQGLSFRHIWKQLLKCQMQMYLVHVDSSSPGPSEGFKRLVDSR